jgi:integrase/recombinase XerD
MEAKIMLSDIKSALARTISRIDFIPDWANSFYQAKRVEGVSAYTLTFYKQQLGHFLKYCEAQVIDQLAQVTPNFIRSYLLWLDENGHNPGGQHAAYRVLKTFLRWYEFEREPEGWRNPISKVKAPRLTEEPLEPVEILNVQKMANSCDGSFLGRRDKAILLCLLDTGLRAREFLYLNLDDIDLVTGSVLVRLGKGRKSRTVFFGSIARKALRAYLRERTDALPVLWVTDDRTSSLTYGGLRPVLTRRAKSIGIIPPKAHDFRRAFALAMLRNGVDLVTLSRLMGHTTIKVLQRYLNQLPEDLQQAHRRGSPVDKMMFMHKIRY